MATEEEARAMAALIRYAGETRNFPGVEAARDAIEEMKEIPMAAGQQGRFTIGLAVANNEAALSHASTLIARSASAPEIRIIDRKTTSLNHNHSGANRTPLLA